MATGPLLAQLREWVIGMILVLGLAACIAAPKIVGPLHTPIPPSKVRVFKSPLVPRHYTVVAKLDRVWYGGCNSSTLDRIVLARFRKQASRVGSQRDTFSLPQPFRGCGANSNSTGRTFLLSQACAQGCRGDRCAPLNRSGTGSSPDLRSSTGDPIFWAGGLETSRHKDLRYLPPCHPPHRIHASLDGQSPISPPAGTSSSPPPDRVPRWHLREP